MKKIMFASCLLIAIALLLSARWGTKAVNAPPDGTLGTPDTTLAVALSLEDNGHSSGCDLDWKLRRYTQHSGPRMVG